ncbi:MAG: hypothetical protein P4L46_24215 [Fimbriimonas sp.]|nr:hypothetical protein [Fimbriimonas sp.]
MVFTPNIRVFLASAILGGAMISFGQSDVAGAPPMGWNSYDCFSYAVNEGEVLQNADFMAKSLKRYGWQYVVVDYVWSSPRLRPDFALNQTDGFSPRLNMDRYGRLLPDTDRFPSSANGAGFRNLADSIHRRGLKFGIHLMRGIPRQAVADNTPIEGSNLRAGNAYTKKGPCGWLNHMWGLDMDQPAAQAYLDSIFRLYAQWHVDFVKVDDLSNPYSSNEVEGYRRAIEHCGRPIVLSLSPGPTPLEQGRHVSEYANMWRLLGDLWDTWDQLDDAFRPVADWTPYRGPDHWPDPDMLPLGRLRKYGPMTGPPNTDSRLTKDEARTMMTLWCISKSPLMFGGNLPDTDPYTLSLITNGEVLAIDQRSSNNRALAVGLKPIWVADANDPLIKYLAVFNRTSEPATVAVKLSDLGIKTAKLRDLWLHKDLGPVSQTLSATVPPHGAMLYKLYVVEAASVTETVLPTIDLSGTSYEAESPDNTLTGQTRVVDDVKDGKCSGEKYVGFIGANPQNTLRFNKVNVDKAGDYVMALVYMSGSHRQTMVRVNGGDPIVADCPSTGGWDGKSIDAVEVRIHLNQGVNTIEFGNPKDWAVNIDRILIRA